MSQFAGDDTMSILDSINDGRHYVPKEPKETEEKPPISKNKKLLILCIVAVLLLTLLLVRANSLSLSMLFKGIDATTVSYFVEEAENTDMFGGVRFSVFHADTAKGEPSLVYAVKNAFGFWRVEDVATISEEQPWVFMSWREPGDHWSFQNGLLGSGGQYHIVYKGTDACADIVFTDGQLPDNCAVQINQSGAYYVIHLIGFTEDIQKQPVREYLEANGCVAAK